MTTSSQEQKTAPTVQGHPRRRLILGVISLAQLPVALDNTVLNVAIPRSPVNRARRSQSVGAVAVLLGGVVAAVLLRRAEKLAA
ncbi:hypothetical protein [Streptomyces sp. NPDC058985]|uniref:hypothetical protein n=1 Tax=Streptomyces sp. NPDC058985 TaxID=3346684 RepID=UPI0036A41A08